MAQSGTPPNIHYNINTFTGPPVIARPIELSYFLCPWAHLLL